MTPLPRAVPRAPIRPLWVVAASLLVAAAGMAVHQDIDARSRSLRLVANSGVAAPGPSPRRGPVATDAGRSTRPALAIYHVRPGDTLRGVAALHSLSLDELVAFNRAGSTPRRLLPGTILHIPDVPVAPTGLDVGHRSGIADLVGAWAGRTGLAPELLLAVTWRESSWRQDVVSDKGAIGIGQILPDTAAWVSDRLAGRPLDPGVAEDNVEASARYLAWLLEREDGDLAAALADYHQGRESVATDGWYSVTTEYVSDVLRLRHEFRP